MNDADLFYFSPVPSLSQEVNECLDQCGLRAEVLPGLTRLLEAALGDDDARRGNILHDIATAFRLAQSHCRPYTYDAASIDQAFYCAVAMAQMPAEYVQKALDASDDPAIWTGYTMLTQYRAMDMEKVPSRCHMDGLDEPVQMLVEVQAVMDLTRACAVAENLTRAGAGPLCEAFERVNRYRPLMQSRHTHLGAAFKRHAYQLETILNRPKSDNVMAFPHGRTRRLAR